MLKRNGEREKVREDEEHEKNKLNRNGNGPFIQKKSVLCVYARVK